MTAVAGGPTNLADFQAILNATVSKPLVRLVQQAAQSLASDTDTAITFGASSEDVDTHGFHDTGSNTSRITPSVAGWYRLSGTVWLTATTDVISFYASIGKNGTIVASRNRLVLPSTATASVARSHAVNVMQQANGSTDYFELFGRQLKAAAAALNTNVSGSFSCSLECEFLRPL